MPPTSRGGVAPIPWTSPIAGGARANSKSRRPFGEWFESQHSLVMFEYGDFVEVIGRYSNPPRTPVDLQRLLSTACLESSDPTSERPPRQHQRRLRPGELSQLKSGYLSGVGVKELAQRFGITRQTVVECMRRAGVPRRYPKLGLEAIDKAASLYRSGWSLVAVGEALSVDPSTVRRVLVTQGVPMRDPQGRERRT